ncbi:MAG: hypothetical protein J2P47_16800 [Acetobacteraceae bacterium]|nr:hypothetical protein [Acetobacteraceae bacterium]
MARQDARQKDIVGRVMHEFKHGELETRGRRVRSPRQAVAIGLSEAGASRNRSGSENRHSRARTESKERRGQTAQQRKEGRPAVSRSRAAQGARRKARIAVKPQSRKAAPAAGRSVARRTRRSARGEPTRAALYAETRRLGLSGCSRMSKAELARVLRQQ